MLTLAEGTFRTDCVSPTGERGVVGSRGKQGTDKQTQDHVMETQDTLVALAENTKEAQKRTLFRTIFRLHAATIKEFDSCAVGTAASGARAKRHVAISRCY